MSITLSGKWLASSVSTGPYLEPTPRSSECADPTDRAVSSGSTQMLDFTSPEVGSPGTVMSFLNIVGTWSGKGTLGADLHTSHLGRLVGKKNTLLLVMGSPSLVSEGSVVSVTRGC